MFRRVFFCITLISLVCIYVPRAYASTPDPSAVVEIKIWDSSIKDYSAFASGVLLDNNQILTDFHVAKFAVDNPSRYQLKVCLSNQIDSLPSCGYAAVPDKANKGLDLAVLSLVGKDLPTSKSKGINLANFSTDLTTLNIKKGAEIQTLGYSKDTLTYSSGQVIGYQYNPANNLVYVDSSAPAGPGDSGGGAFDQDNNFIGIVKGGKINDGKLIFSGIIPVSTVNFWLSQIQNSGGVQQPTLPQLSDYTVASTESELCELGDNDYCLSSQTLTAGVGSVSQQPLTISRPNQPTFVAPVNSGKTSGTTVSRPSFLSRIFNWLFNRPTKIP